MADGDLERGVPSQRKAEDSLTVETEGASSPQPLQSIVAATDRVDSKEQSGTKSKGSELSVDGDGESGIRYTTELRGTITIHENRALFSPPRHSCNSEYFQELARFCLATKNLPSISIGQNSRLSEWLGESRQELYDGVEGQPLLLPTNFESPKGFILVLRIWNTLESAHLETEMR
jgi:hypothetical protein